MEDGSAAAGEMVVHALGAASRGRVIPLHECRRGVCSCRQGASCRSAGKHPRTANGLKDGSRDEAQVRAWWRKWPHANVGILTGAGFCDVLDVDAGDKGGTETLRALVERNGGWQHGTVVDTASGGFHLYMAHTPGKRNGVCVLGPGLDWRTDGGYVVAPGSRVEDADGAVRRWSFRSGSWGSIHAAAPPAWVVGRLVDTDAPAAPSKPRPTSRHGQMLTLAVAMRKRGQPDADVAKAVSDLNRSFPEPKEQNEIDRICAYACALPAGMNQTQADAYVHDQTISLRYRRQSNIPHPNYGNAHEVMAKDPRWQGAFRWNELDQVVETTIDTPAGPAGAWTNAGNTAAAVWLSREWFLDASPGVVADVVEHLAKAKPVNPVREWMEGLKWDGEPRLSSWHRTVLAADPDQDEAFVSAACRAWLVSAVARAFSPGCKADHMLVLEGRQGTGKSSCLASLCPRPTWFAELGGTLNQQSVQQLRGKWIMEFSELGALSRSDVESAKAFLSCADDHYREPYAHSAQNHPRRCVFAGSTNRSAYLADDTGNRRFWPIKCGRIDLALLREVRDQLWAEAVAAYMAGEKWHLEGAVAEAQHEAQAERVHSDAWEDVICDHLRGTGATRTTVAELFPVLVGQRDKMALSDQHRVGRALTSLGWKKRTTRVGTRQVRIWEPDPSRWSP